MGLLRRAISGIRRAFGREGRQKRVERKLKDFDRFLDKLEPQLVEAVQEHAERIEHPNLARHATEHQIAFNDAGNPVKFRANTPQWERRKRRRGWSTKRLNATGVLYGALKKRSVVRRTKTGFRLDPTRASRRIRHYYRFLVNGRRSPRGMPKAPTLMKRFRKGWEERFQEAVERKLGDDLARLKRGGGKTALGIGGIGRKKARERIVLRLEKLGLKRMLKGLVSVALIVLVASCTTVERQEVTEHHWHPRPTEIIYEFEAEGKPVQRQVIQLHYPEPEEADGC